MRPLRAPHQPEAVLARSLVIVESPAKA
ncbi:MAG: hypothetical protein F4X31_00595, partial [Gammaproteobacteria bacterium]|nr:hypothetical protein [Gammaproteobacteria bacterium]